MSSSSNSRASEEREKSRKRSFSEFISNSSTIHKNPLVLYQILEDEGYFLPSKKKFSREWAVSFLREEKDFLKRLEIEDYTQIAKENVNWDRIKEAIQDPKVTRYFFYDGKTLPNLGYFCRIMSTVYPEWIEREVSKGEEK